MHTITNGQYHIKIKKLLGPFYLAVSFLLNYLKICDSWEPFQFFV